MELYVALCYTSGDLGRTIVCLSREQAVGACVCLAREQGDEITGDRLEALGRDHNLTINTGGKVHFSRLEDTDNLAVAPYCDDSYGIH